MAGTELNVDTQNAWFHEGFKIIMDDREFKIKGILGVCNLAHIIFFKN